MIPGPIAVLILAIAVVWLSPQAAGVMPILLFSGVGVVTWLILHPLTGALLGRVARARLKDDARLQLMEASSSTGLTTPLFYDEVQRELMADRVYQISYLALFMVKWAAIIGVSWLVTV